jgi:predicted transcriptional regulator
MDSIRFPTYRKYLVMSRAIEQLNVRHKRNIFQYMRDLELVEGQEGSNHTFIPAYGMTLGEFSLFQLMN